MVTFYGDAGSLVLTGGNGYKILDPKGKQTGQGSGPGGDQVHMANFLEAIRSGGRPNAPIEEGQKSTLLCHLGNIAWRVGRAIDFDPATRRVLHDPEAGRLLGREYRPGFQPQV